MTRLTDDPGLNSLPNRQEARNSYQATRVTAPGAIGSTDQPSAAHPISVLIADDQSLIRTGFAMVINSQPDMRVVGEAADGRVATMMSRQLKPDVILMDVRMPVLDGIHATEQIISQQQAPSYGQPNGAASAGAVANAATERAAGPRIIILTTFDLDEYVLSAIRAGASGFLLKDSSPEVLLSSIRTVHEGNAIIAPSATKRLIERLVGGQTPMGGDPTDSLNTVAWSGLMSGLPSAANPRGDGTVIGQTTAGSFKSGAQGSSDQSATTAPVSCPELDSLTEREREVLIELAHGLSNQEIADKLVVSLPTVKTHVAHLLSKINARDRVQAVVFAYENGLAS